MHRFLIVKSKKTLSEIAVGVYRWECLRALKEVDKETTKKKLANHISDKNLLQHFKAHSQRNTTVSLVTSSIQ